MFGPFARHRPRWRRRRTIRRAYRAGRSGCLWIEIATPKRKLQQRRPGLELVIFLEIESGLADPRSVRPDDQRNRFRLGEMKLEDGNVFRTQTHAIASMAAEVADGMEERVRAGSSALHGSVESSCVLLRQQVGRTALVFDRDEHEVVNRDDCL